MHQLDEPDVQFWLFTAGPYGPASLRNIGWGLFLIGVLVLYAGTVFFGIATWRAGVLPRRGALPLMSWFPAGILAALVLVPPWATGRRGAAYRHGRTAWLRVGHPGLRALVEQVAGSGSRLTRPVSPHDNRAATMVAALAARPVKTAGSGLRSLLREAVLQFFAIHVRPSPRLDEQHGLLAAPAEQQRQ